MSAEIEITVRSGDNSVTVKTTGHYNEHIASLRETTMNLLDKAFEKLVENKAKL